MTGEEEVLAAYMSYRLSLLESAPKREREVPAAQEAAEIARVRGEDARRQAEITEFIRSEQDRVEKRLHRREEERP